MGVVDTLTGNRSTVRIRIDCTKESRLYVRRFTCRTSTGILREIRYDSKPFETVLVGPCVLKMDISSCSGSFWTLFGGMESS